VAVSLAQAEPVKLEVYDVRGRRLRGLFAAEREAGEHIVSWDAATRAGNAWGAVSTSCD
jgi:hypothetical protein